MVQISKFYVYDKFKNYLWNLTLPGAPNPHGSPHHPKPGRLQFFYFLACIATSMVTKNKFFTFAAKLTHSGSRSITSNSEKFLVKLPKQFSKEKNSDASNIAIAAIEYFATWTGSKPSSDYIHLDITLHGPNSYFRRFSGLNLS